METTILDVLVKAGEETAAAPLLKEVAGTLLQDAEAALIPVAQRAFTVPKAAVDALAKADGVNGANLEALFQKLTATGIEILEALGHKS